MPFSAPDQFSRGDELAAALGAMARLLWLRVSTAASRIPATSTAEVRRGTRRAHVRRMTATLESATHVRRGATTTVHVWHRTTALESAAGSRPLIPLKATADVRRRPITPLKPTAAHVRRWMRCATLEATTPPRVSGVHARRWRVPKFIVSRDIVDLRMSSASPGRTIVTHHRRSMPCGSGRAVCTREGRPASGCSSWFTVRLETVACGPVGARHLMSDPALGPARARRNHAPPREHSRSRGSRHRRRAVIE